MKLYDCRDGSVDVVRLRGGGVEDFHWKLPALNVEYFSVVEVARESVCFQCGGHDNDAQSL